MTKIAKANTSIDPPEQTSEATYWCPVHKAEGHSDYLDTTRCRRAIADAARDASIAASRGNPGPPPTPEPNGVTSYTNLSNGSHEPQVTRCDKCHEPQGAALMVQDRRTRRWIHQDCDRP